MQGVLDPQLNSALELSFPFRENLTDLNNHAPCQSNLSLQDVLQDFMRSPAYKNAVKDNPELAQTFGALIYSYVGVRAYPVMIPVIFNLMHDEKNVLCE